MKTWNVRYISYASKVVNMTIETPDDACEQDVLNKAYELDGSCEYSSDCIYQIIDITQY